MTSFQPSTFSPLMVSFLSVTASHLAVEGHWFALRLVLGICVGGEQAREGECRGENMSANAHNFSPFPIRELFDC